MKLLVVIVNYRVTDVTIDCLRTLDGRIQRVADARVVVCENGSGGDAARRLHDAIAANGWGEWAEVTVSEWNRGFTGGNNIAIRAALASGDRPEYVLLLNSDTLVHDGALEALVDFMDAHPAAGIAGSTLLSREGEVLASPYRFFSLASELDRGLRVGPISKLLSPWSVVVPTPARACRVDWVSGASMMLRREMLDEVGLLDEGLFMYYEDVDLCLRARSRGWETWYVPESRIVHLEGASTEVTRTSRKRLPAFLWQARRRFFLKHHGPMYSALADAAFLVGFATWRLRVRLTGKPDTDPEGMLADAFRHSVFLTGFRMREVQGPGASGRAGCARPR